MAQEDKFIVPHRRPAVGKSTAVSVRLPDTMPVSYTHLEFAYSTDWQYNVGCLLYTSVWNSAVTNGIFVRFGDVELSHDEILSMAEQEH